MSLRTLLVHVSWTALARVLGLPRGDDALPCRLDCPLCGRGRLVVAHDIITGGEWHHCRDCGSSGDMIDLAAATWGVGFDAAVARLSAEGLIPEGDAARDLFRRAHARNRRFTRLHRRSLRYMATASSPSLSRLRSRFLLSPGEDAGRWAEGPGRMIGAYPSVRANKLLFFEDDERGTHRKVPGGGYSIQGRRLGDVLIVPYHAGPGRLSGFLLVGRDGAPKDRAFRPIGIRSGLRGPVEAGVACLASLDDGGDASVGRYALAVDDPMLALRIHAKHALTSTRMLPLVAWHDGPTALTGRDAWFAAEDREVVFWAWKMSAGLVNQARSCAGLISIVPFKEVNRKAIEHYLRLAPPLDLARRAIRRARPWAEAVRGWMAGAGDPAAEALCLEMRRYGLDPGSFAAEVGFERMSGEVPGRRRARVGAIEVTEQGGRWVSQRRYGRGEWALSDAIVRVDQIRVGPEPSYVGRVLFAGGEARFTAPAAVLEHDPEPFLVDLCLRAGLGRPRIARGSTKVNLVDVALAFHPAVTVAEAADKPGRPRDRRRRSGGGPG